jgi:hypothetical protein
MWRYCWFDDAKETRVLSQIKQEVPAAAKHAGGETSWVSTPSDERRPPIDGSNY